ncbi:hypothetical protein VTI28DRAFT_6100 [Corynascus sepedonium]
MAQYVRFSKPNPQWEEFVKSQPKLSQFRTGPKGHDVAARRAVFQTLAAEGPRHRRIPDDTEVVTYDFTIPAQDGYQIPVRSYFPCKAGTAQASAADAPIGESNYPPLFIYYHGGGWVFGDLETGDENCRLLCARNTLTVLNVAYRLAPEHVFPTGINDAFDVFKWTVRHVTANVDINGDGSNRTQDGSHHLPAFLANPYKGFIIGGVSAGANMAGAIAYLAREGGLSNPPITGLMLSVPCCLHPDAIGLVPESWRDELLSLDQNRDADLLDVKTYVQLVRDILRAPAEDRRISFLLSPDHSNLPPRAYFQIAGLDPIRDEAMLFARLLREQSGTETLVHMYDGLPHGFWRFQGLPASKRWADDLFSGVEFLLKGGKGGLEVKGHEDGSRVVVNGLDEYIAGVA